jgi:hypothetical protein
LGTDSVSDEVMLAEDETDPRPIFVTCADFFSFRELFAAKAPP